MKNILLQLLLMLSVYNLSKACGCLYRPTTFCETIGIYDSRVALVEITNYGRIESDFSPEHYHPYMEVSIIDQIRGDIEQDTINVFIQDGFNCGFNGYFPIGDTLVFNMERDEYPVGSTYYELSGCGQHFLYYDQDSVFSQINYQIDKLSYADFVEYIEECYNTPVRVSMKGQVKNIKTGELLSGYPFEVNTELLRTDAIGNYEVRIPYEDYDRLEKVRIRKETDSIEDVSTADLVRINQHILTIDKFSENWQYIAADIDNSRTVTVLDIIYLKRLILGIDQVLPRETNTILISEAHFRNWRTAINPFLDPYFRIIEDHYLETPDYGESIEGYNILVIKIGDVI